MKASDLRRLINLWPPLLGSGIAITEVSPDYRFVKVALRQRWYNRNVHGVHFGGSLFAMTDVPYALMIMNVLGADYMVWDKSAEIEFISPGRGTVTAEFRLSDEVIAEIRHATQDGGKYLPRFEVEVFDATGKLVARAHRELYVRKRATAHELG